MSILKMLTDWVWSEEGQTEITIQLPRVSFLPRCLVQFISGRALQLSDKSKVLSFQKIFYTFHCTPSSLRIRFKWWLNVTKEKCLLRVQEIQTSGREKQTRLDREKWRYTGDPTESSVLQVGLQLCPELSKSLALTSSSTVDTGLPGRKVPKLVVAFCS